MTRTIAIRIACLLASCALWQVRGQLTVPSPPEKPVSFDRVLRVTSAAMQRQNGESQQLVPVEIEVQRLSDKTITAYGLKLAIRYADGSEGESQVAADLIRSLVPELSPDLGLTQVGLKNRMTFYPPGGNKGSAAVFVSADVVWVAFDDNSVLGPTDAQGLQVVEDLRKEESDYLANLLSELREIEKQPDVAAEFAEGSRARVDSVAQKAIADRKSAASPGRQSRFSRQRDNDLGAFAASASVGKVAFEHRLEIYSRLQAVMAKQCNLKENK